MSAPIPDDVLDAMSRCLQRAQSGNPDAADVLIACHVPALLTEVNRLRRAAEDTRDRIVGMHKNAAQGTAAGPYAVGYRTALDDVIRALGVQR